MAAELLVAPAALPRHRIVGEHFTALVAGGGGPEAVTELARSERSWRMIALRAVIEVTRADPSATGPLPPVDQTWQLLRAAWQQVPEVVEQLVSSPTTGAWAGYLLRRMRGHCDSAETPLWFDVGYLHTLAVAAAARAGLDFASSVPVRAGVAVLPSLGCALVGGPAPFGTAGVCGASGHVTLTGASAAVVVGSGDGWQPFWRIATEAGQTRLDLILDDLDPYRELVRPVPVRRLSTGELARWRELFNGAWATLTRAAPATARTVASGMVSVAPRPSAEPFRPLSASAGDAFGTAIVSLPDDEVQLAVTLVHEFQHAKLGGLLHVMDFHDRSVVRQLYAPWRDDPRPTAGVLQGVYAFCGIVQFWRVHRRVVTGDAHHLAQFEFALWRAAAWHTLQDLRELPEFTRQGRRLLDGLYRTMAAWQDDDVPTGVLAVATTAACAHRCGWRLHHLTPAADLVAELVRRWETAQPPTPAALRGESSLTPDLAARALDAVTVLYRWRWSDSAGFEQLCRQPERVGASVPGASAADVALVSGDASAAQQRYLAALVERPGDRRAWAGLCGAQHALGPGPAASALGARPELVRAVSLAVATSDKGSAAPLPIAEWLGRGD